MSNIDKVSFLLKYIDKSETSAHNSYKVSDGKFIHMHYGWQKTYPKEIDETEAASMVDILCLIYANEMRVSLKLVRESIKKL